MKQRNLEEFCSGLSDKRLRILKTMNELDPQGAGLKSRRIAGEVLGTQFGRGGPQYISGRKIKLPLENLRERGLVQADGSKPMDWKLTKRGEKILEEVGSDG